MRIQERVEDIYSSANYGRALLIYRDELAPLGDKYAQYMVGYMHLQGQGVEPDKVAALAWYRLAGERGENVLRTASAELAKTMSAEEIAESNQLFVQLWNRIGDTRLIMGLIQRDMEQLRQQTGSRIPGSMASAPVTVYNRNGEPMSPTYYDDIRNRMEGRLAYLRTKVEVNDLALEVDELDKQELERQAREALAAVGNRRRSP